MTAKKRTRAAIRPAAPTAKTADEAGAPMTLAQIAQLKALSRQAGDPDAFGETLTRGEAQKRIAALQILLDREEHSGAERLPRT
jgi:hypothetical protein